MPVEQKSPINLASRLGRVENLKELLAAHGNNQECQTAQRNATRVSDTTSVKDLIGTGSYATNKTLNEPLISAVKNGHAEMVEELLKYGADVNATDEDGDTALMTAIKLSIQPIFQLLVDWGAEVNAENNEGQTALYLAVTQSHTEYDRMQKQDQNKELVLEGSSLIVYTLLRKGTHLYETRSGLNPCTVHLTSAEFKNPNPTILKLLDAAGFKEKENIKELSSVDHFQACAKDCIREHLKHVHPKRNLYFTVPQLGLPKRLQSSLLLNAVKHSDVIPNNQETKFLQKIKEGDIENVQHLINAGVDINVQDENDMTPLMIASVDGHKELVEQLIKSGADVNLQNTSGDTPLIYAFKDVKNKSAVIYLKGINHMENSQECMQVLLQHDAEINIQGKDGDTALMHLADTASYLVQFKKSQSEMNFTRVLTAVEKCVFSLNDAGADPNLKNDNDCTALILGANILNFVKLLIRAGADVNWKDKIGNTALNRAAYLGEVKCVEKLIQSGAEINIGSTTPLMAAAKIGQVECLKLLIREGADLDILGKDGLTALMVAALKEQVETVKQLIRQGADLDVQDENGVTALVWAAFKGQVECVKLLVQEGADLDIQDKHGHIVLMLAAVNGHVECVKLLMQVRTHLDIWDEKGRTALMYTASYGHVECVKLLIRGGADLDIQDKNGYTALMWAADKGHVKCVKLLVQAEADLDIRDENGITALVVAARTGADSCFSALLNAGAEVDSSLETAVLHRKQTKRQLNLQDAQGSYSIH